MALARERARDGDKGRSADDESPADPAAPPRKNRLRYFLHAAVFAGLVVAGMKYINGDEFWNAVHRFNWWYAPAILAISIVYVLVKGWRFVTQMREVTDTSRGLMLRGYVAGQACTLLPAGMAARAGLLRQVGIPVEDSAASIAIAAFADQAVLIACALISALWFEAARTPALVLLSALAVLSLLLGIEATRTWLLGVIDWLMGKVNLRERWHSFLESLEEMASPSLLLGSVGNSAIGFGLMILALYLAVRGVGAEVPAATLFLAFTLPTMLGRISAMPGGVGVTEAGMIGILDAAPGVSASQAAAATILFRIGTVFFAALVGAVVYFILWRGSREVQA